MKKLQLKSLHLNKKLISDMKYNTINGGKTGLSICYRQSVCHTDCVDCGHWG